MSPLPGDILGIIPVYSKEKRKEKQMQNPNNNNVFTFPLPQGVVDEKYTPITREEAQGIMETIAIPTGSAPENAAHHQPAIVVPGVEIGREHARYFRYENYSKETVMSEISFGVLKKPTFYKDGDGHVQQSKQFSIIRADNGKELGSVKEGYQIITHAETVEPGLTALKDLGYCFKQVAMKNNGGQLMIEAVSPNNPIKINGDDHYPRVVIRNSYDTGTSAEIQFGFFRGICTNGVILPAFKGSTHTFRVRHTKGAQESLANWKNALSQTNWIVECKNRLESLSDKILTPEQMRSIMAEVFEVVESKVNENKNIKEAIWAAFYGQGQPGHGQIQRLTAWELFNGITQRLRDNASKANADQMYTRLETMNQRTEKALKLLLAA